MASWAYLPNEMKFAIVDMLDNVDLRAVSTTERNMYSLCIPSLFQTVKLNNWRAMTQFLANVPMNYLAHTLNLELCTQLPDCDENLSSSPSRTEAIMSILGASPRIRSISLNLAGPIEKRVISLFSGMDNLRKLSVSNCADENILPISERFVVSVAASIPCLEELSLDCITRSQLHVRDENIPYYVPLVIGDQDIPDHPTLGSELSLPSLLRIPSLRRLTIRGTHLGDARWATVDVNCKLQFLDLGSCCHENDDFNRVCTERIMAAVGPTVDEFSLTTSVSDAKFAKPSITPLQKLRKLHISPFFPVDNIVDTVSNLAGSPIESLSVQCYEDDVVDTCTAVEEFLNLRVERGPQFYDKLSKIHVTVTANEFPDTHEEHDEDPMPLDHEELKERSEAVKRLQEFCNDLKLASEVGKESLGKSIAAATAHKAQAYHVAADDDDDDKCVSAAGRYPKHGFNAGI